MAADVKNAHGQLLIRKGIEVTERHVRVLKSWGVAEVQLEGDEGSAEGGSVIEHYDPAILDSARTDVMNRLRFNSIEHPVIDELVRICVNRCARELVSNPVLATAPPPPPIPAAPDDGSDSGGVAQTALKT